MGRFRAFIVGCTLFAESIAQMLRDSETVEVVGAASTIETAMLWLEADSADAIIVTGRDRESAGAIGPVFAAHRDVAIIRADLNTDQLQVITSRCVQARCDDLLAAIASLPKQN